MMAPRIICLCQLLFLSITSSTLILTVPGATDECVFERVEKSNKLQGSFEVVSGVGEVIASVYGPNGELHFNSDKAKSNRLNVMAPLTGLYKLCLTNRDRDEKSVALSLHVGDDLFQSIAKQEHITPLEQEITQLADGISRIEDEQQYMWAREKHTAETNSSTNSRVLWFSIGEVSVLVGLGLWWVFTMRFYFERKSSA